MARNNISYYKDDLVSIGSPLVLAAAEVYTIPRLFGLGTTEIQALDWDLTQVGTVDLDVDFLQTNDQAGTPTLWSNPTLAGSSTTNSLTIITKVDGTDISLAPSGFVEIRLTNNAGVSLTINRMTLFNQ